MAYSKRKITVGESYSPGKSALQGLMEGYLSSSQTRQKSQSELEKSMIPKMMEIQSRYKLQGMKDQEKQKTDSMTEAKKEVAKLENKLDDIRSYYKRQKNATKLKLASLNDDKESIVSALLGKQENTVNPKEKKLNDYMNQLDIDQANDEAEIEPKIKRLKSAYGLE